VTQVV